MLEGAPDTISASAYGLGSDRVRELLTQLARCQREDGERANLSHRCPNSRDTIVRPDGDVGLV